MRIAVITDVHANLPALEAAVGAIHACGCDAIVHTGDAIAIGPYPAECYIGRWRLALNSSSSARKPIQSRTAMITPTLLGQSMYLFIHRRSHAV